MFIYVLTIMTRIKKLDFIILIIVAALFYVTKGDLSINITGPDHGIEGSTLTFVCTAINCNGTCIFKWNFSGKGNVSRPDTLNIIDIHREQNTTVICTATDDSDKKSTVKTYEVYYGPDSITIQPNGIQTARVEGGIWPTITCSATCNPSPCAFIWKKDGISYANQPKLFDQNKKVQRDDAASYTCEALNSINASMTVKKSIDLTVHYGPSVSTIWSSKTLTCRADDGKPSTFDFLRWEHSIKGLYIRHLNGSQKNNMFTYTFGSMSFEDRGDYKCTVKNSVGEALASQEVPGYDKPQLVRSTQNYNVSKHSSLGIQVTVYARPPVTKVSDVRIRNNASDIVNNVVVLFSKDQAVVLFYNRRIAVDVQKVQINIPSVKEEYFGTLSITIANSEGSLTSRTVLFPEGPPDPPSDLKVSDLSHDEVTLTFRSGFFNGASQTFVIQYRPNYEGSTWLNGTSVEAGEEKNVSLHAGITDLSPETTYLFRAFGYNIYDRSPYTNTVINATTYKEPLDPAVIIGGAVGGTLLIMVIIVIGGAVWKYNSRRRKSKKASYKEPPGYQKPDGEDNKDAGRGIDNSTYNTELPYENSQMQNGNLVAPKDFPKKAKQSNSQENIYINANEGQQFADVGQPYMATQVGPGHSSGSLVATEGYIDLQGGGNRDDDAYAVGKLKIEPNVDDSYVDMDTFKATKGKNPLVRKASQPQYSNVSKEIGLLNSANDEEKTYVTMNAARSAQFTSQEDPYIDMSTTKAKSSNPYKLEGEYVSMNSQKANPKVGMSSKRVEEKSQYLNLRAEGVFDDRPPISSDQTPGYRTSGKGTNRDSMPSYEAPLPPGLRLQTNETNEEDYMNITVKKMTAKFKSKK